jgi:hypothetical protein
MASLAGPWRREETYLAKESSVFQALGEVPLEHVNGRPADGGAANEFGAAPAEMFVPVIEAAWKRRVNVACS